jgi:PIN domain nuclease of toxin-antitoxin system
MKKILLDTHALIWFFNGDGQLSATACDVIVAPFNRKYVSIASIWEIAIKIRLKKLVFNGGISEILKLIEDNGFELLPVRPTHILTLESLPGHHRDPFDRILIASAISENMSIVSIDDNFHLYEKLKIIW